MNQVRGTSIYLRRPGPLESKRNDWWRDNERFSVQVSTKTTFFQVYTQISRETSETELGACQTVFLKNSLHRIFTRNGL